MRQNFSKLLIGITIIFSLFLLYSCDKREEVQSGGRDIAASEVKATPAVLVETVRPIIQRVEHRIRAVGSFFPEDEVTITPGIGGKVEKILIDEGYAIKKGQLLVQLEGSVWQLPRPKPGFGRMKPTWPTGSCSALL